MNPTINIYKTYDPQDLEMQDKIKSNLKNLLTNSVPYCGLCLNIDVKTYALDVEIVEACLYPKSNESLKQMLLEVLGNEIMQNIPSLFICHQCTEGLQMAYNYKTRIHRTTNLLHYYVDQITNQAEEVHKVMETTDTSEVSNTLLVISEYLPVDKKSLNLPIIKLKTKKSMFQCNYCNVQMETRGHMNNHIREKHQTNKEVICPECKEVGCLHKRYLEAFKQKKPKGHWYKCIDCNYEAKNRLSFIAHANKTHLRRFPFMCTHCGIHFHAETLLRAHMKLMHSEGITCRYCDKDFKTATEQALHTTICCASERNHKCDICPASFDTEDQLDSHKTKHEKKYKCQQCPRTFKYNSNYMLHTKTHAKSTRIVLRDCNRSCTFCSVATNFTNTREYRLHLATHRPDETHKCIPCKLELKTKSELYRHRRTAKHTLKAKSVLPFTCPECDFSAITERTLESHRNMTHFNVKPYLCDMCNKSFSTEQLLQNHVYRHKGIKDYRCDQCGAEFTSRLGLKKHQFRKHSTGDSNRSYFTCEVCGASFFHRSLYDNHVKNKHSEKTEACPLCPNMYHTVKATRMHIQKVHARDRDLQELIRSEGLEQVFIDRRVHRLK